MPEKSTHIQGVLQESTQNNKLAFTDIREEPVNFFNETAWAFFQFCKLM